MLAAFAFAGAAIFSVDQRSKQDQQICDAVKGVRDDVVSALTKIENRAISNAKTPEERKVIIEAYEGKDGLITIIGDPKCP